MTVGVIGTTITPWMQFYLQSSIVDKGVSVRQYKASRLDVIVGSIFTDVVAWFIVVACAATLYTHGMRNIADPSDAAEAMKPLAGQYAFILFAAGLFNASLFAASILPLSTAYTVCEGLGVESGLDKSFREAKFFYWLYSLLLFAGAAVVLIPNFPLVKFSILSQVLNGVLLPARSGLHAEAHQQARADGQIHQHPVVQRDRMDHRDHRDRAVAHPGLEPHSTGRNAQIGTRVSEVTK